MNEPETSADDAARVLAVLRAHEAAGNAFESAGVQLCRLMLMLEDPAEPLAEGGRSAEEWHREVFRRLLEFLNTAHAFNARMQDMSALSGGADAPGASPLSSFLEEIRTCMTHRAVPRMMLVSFAAPAPKLRALHMDVSAMLSWPHWSPGARHFLHQNQPHLPLTTAVHEYLQAVRMSRQRAVRHFRATFAGIIAAAPPAPVMMHIM